MNCVYSDEAPSYLSQVPAVDILRQVWIQQYFCGEHAGEEDGNCSLRWRRSGNLPPSAQMISSPYDLDVRHSSKRGIQAWMTDHPLKGYRMQITETCNPNKMMVITNVETTASTDQDWSAARDLSTSTFRRRVFSHANIWPIRRTSRPTYWCRVRSATA